MGSARDPDNTVCENGQCEGENGVMKLESVPYEISEGGARCDEKRLSIKRLVR